jgi:DNA repair protein RadC
MGALVVSGEALAELKCPHCGGAVTPNDSFEQDHFFRPWHVIHGRAGVRAYVESLGDEAIEWLLALYVDQQVQLLSVETVSQGDVSCNVPFWKLLDRGRSLKAAGFILVHNHPSGDPRPSFSDIQITNRLAQVSRDLDVPLLDHLIITKDGMMSCGNF